MSLDLEEDFSDGENDIWCSTISISDTEYIQEYIITFTKVLIEP